MNEIILKRIQLKKLKKLYDEYFDLQSLYFEKTYPPVPDVVIANIDGKVKAMKKVFEILELKNDGL